MSATTDDILLELRELRKMVEELTKRPTTAQPPSYPAPSYAPRTGTSAGGGKFDDEPVPQPSQPWNLDDARRHQIHFGKNAGRELGSLSENSLSFYAKEKPPQLNREGRPFPKRPADLDLENAARTIWHTNRGTLATGAGQPPAPRQSAPTPSTPVGTNPVPASENLDGDVPF